jgi:Ser/Thr protein kinase RdoA (MazF antagonist)
MLSRGDLSADGLHFYDGPDWGWQPLWLTADRVLEVAHEHYRVDATGAALLSEGLLNQSWRLHCADHDRVLRVSRTERTLEQVRYEDRVVAAWSPIRQVVAPETDLHPVINGHVITVYPFCDGVPGTGIDPVLRARQLAPVMAQLHRRALEIDLPQRPGARSLDDLAATDQWLPVRSAVIDRFGDGPEILADVAVVDAAVAELDEQVAGWRSDHPDAPRAVVHADLNARNQLYRDGRLVGIIDTDDCRIEPLVAEVAGLAHSDPAVSPRQVWQDYLAAGGPLDPSAEQMLLPFARLGAVGELQWFTDDDGRATHLAAEQLRNLVADLGGRPARG